MKEIRKEARQQEVRRQRRQLRVAMRKHEKVPKFPTPFQLPGELAPSLRQLKVCPHLIFIHVGMLLYSGL